MPLVYLPDREVLFRLGAELDATGAHGLPTGSPARARLATPYGTHPVTGEELPLVPTISVLALLPVAELEARPPTVAVWTLASKLALELVARERVAPAMIHRGGRLEARWAAALAAPEDAGRVMALAASMPPAAHAVPGDARGTVWAADALLRAFLDAAVDAVVRGARGAPAAPSRTHDRGALGGAPWAARWQAALVGSSPAFEAEGFAERGVVAALARWSEPALGARDRLRACFRLELTDAAAAPFVLRFVLQSPDDPSLLVTADDVWGTAGRTLERLGRAFRDPQETLLEALGRAAQLFAPLGAALADARPTAIALEPASAWAFLAEGASALAEAGFGVIVPAELTAGGQRRLRVRMRVGGGGKTAGVVDGGARLGLDELVDVRWEAVLGEHVVTARELAQLAQLKAPLVRLRGQWVAIDPRELDALRARVAAGRTQLPAREAMRAALAGEVQHAGHAVAVVASGALADLLERVRSAADARGDANVPARAALRVTAVPAALRATLRPYQHRGLGWLATMGDAGLGACLADDMGLGKTVQLLAYLLHRRARQPRDRRPALLVAPTSVLGNWERELERFAPSLPIARHYGGDRARTAAALGGAPGALVLTTYGLLRRDAALLADVAWSVVALDEAQNIKNAASATARAARALRADHRFALTGTPVENRLAELWSILEFANPGLLGPLDGFRRDFAIPIERHNDDAAAARLRRITAPFILRRLKSDPAIIQDLPAKHEMNVVCTLTREQASLYKAVVDEELRRIAASEGIARRGRVLALLAFTKQVCNHPAHYLGERGPLADRSGKLARVTEMLDEALAAGDKALVFTQFREMGELLVAHLGAALGCEIAFLHGGTPKAARDALVRRFQDEPRGPRVFVLSVKAGGTGLNLTAANHVFHYDRWWNPAVEDQATDRAYRIGQRRRVQVHKLVCAGTVEEKIDRMLADKRALAARIVGAGEQWITELGTDALRELFALTPGVVAIAADGELDDATTQKPRTARAARAARAAGPPPPARAPRAPRTTRTAAREERP